MKNIPLAVAGFTKAVFEAFRTRLNRLFRPFTVPGAVETIDQQKAAGEVPACCCSPAVPVQGDVVNKNIAVKSAKSFSSILVSLLVAFFPKCPVCWAAYMSMFGGFSVSRLPYQGWLYPVLIGFLSLHLVLIFRNRRKKGLGPFTVSLAGVLIILLSRTLGVEANFPFIIGMLCILSGSLWNSFSLAPLSVPSLLKPLNP